MSLFLLHLDNLFCSFGAVSDSSADTDEFSAEDYRNSELLSSEPFTANGRILSAASQRYSEAEKDD